MSTSTISMIVAMGENHVIGADGGMPWRLRDDLVHFMRTTKHHPVIMGRATYESLDGPLKDRTNIVMTRQSGGSYPDGVLVAGSLDAALELAATSPGSEEIFIAGGGTIYEQSMDRAHRLYLTLVHARPDGDTRFPEFDLRDWNRVSESHQEADDRNSSAFTILILERSA